MSKEISIEAMELSFKVLETILVMKEFKDKDEVLEMANVMKTVAIEDGSYPQVVKDAYVEVVNKLNGLSFEEMVEIRDIVSED